MKESRRFLMKYDGEEARYYLTNWKRRLIGADIQDIGHAVDGSGGGGRAVTLSGTPSVKSKWFHLSVHLRQGMGGIIIPKG